MPKPITHKRREFIQPSFPNNRLSSRPRKKRVEKQEWVEDDFTQYLRVPDNAISSPYDLPNPTDSAPSFSDSYTMNYSETGGYAPPGFFDEFFPVQMGMVPGLASGLENFQFNPFMQENIPPVIENDAYDTHTDWAWTAILFVPVYLPVHSYATIDFSVTEVAPYDVIIKIIDSGDSVSFSGQAGTNWHHAVLNIDYLTDVLLDYTVNITATDTAGNGVAMEHKVDGIIVGLANVFAYLMWGWMADAYSMVTAAMNWLVEMIMGIIQGIIDVVLAPLIQAIANFANSFSSLFNSPFDNNDMFSLLFDSGFTYVALALITALIAIQVLSAPFSFGIGTIIGLVVPLVLVAIFGLTSSGDSMLNGAVEFIVEGLISGLALVGWASQYVDMILLGVISSVKIFIATLFITTGIAVGWDLVFAVFGILIGIASIGMMTYRILDWENKDKEQKMFEALVLLSFNVLAVIWYLFISKMRSTLPLVAWVLISWSLLGMFTSLALMSTVALLP